jgi:CubicO group peptidase (beta-lactamase class C family)
LLVSCASSKPTAVDVVEGSTEESWAKLSTFILKEMKAKRITGASVSIANSNGEIWSSGFGMADVKRKIPFSSDTISNVGSVSKLITTTAIMKLVEANKLELDIPVTKYLPELKPRTRFPNSRPITLRDMLTHHSGLPSDYLKSWSRDGVPPEDYPEQFLKDTEYAASLYSTNPPGRAWSYSNLCYGMLGIIVERVSDLKFEDYCRKEILDPLGMSDSSFILPNGFDVNPKFAKGYERGKEHTIPYIRDLPAASFDSTAQDLAKFMSYLLSAWKGEGGILSPETVREMFTIQNKETVADAGFKIGLTFWIIDTYNLPGEYVVGHGGDIGPYHALMLLLPERGLSVSLLTNSGDDAQASMGLDGIAEQAIRTAISVTGGPTIAAPRALASAIQAPREAIENLTGTYVMPMGVIRIKSEGKGLKVYAFGHWLDGVWRSDSSIGLEFRFLGCKIPIAQLEGIALRPFKLEGQSAFGLEIRGMPYATVVKADLSPVTEIWKTRLGIYDLVDMKPGDVIHALKLTVEKDTGLLMVDVTAFGENVSLPLRIVNEKEAVTQGLGRYLGETFEVEGTDLQFGGLRFRKK